MLNQHEHHLTIINVVISSTRYYWGIYVLLISVGVLTTTVGCGRAPATTTVTKTSDSTPAAPPASSITPKQFADAVHAVMMADRTVYATHVVTNLKKQGAPVKAMEYWKDEKNAIPLPAQMFRMGAELVNENPQAGFNYALKSQWPLNAQNKATGLEVEAMKFIADHPNENFYQEEELGGKKYFTAVYADKAVAEACWDCHNNHENKADDYPTFKKDDVMGGVVVRIPLN